MERPGIDNNLVKPIEDVANTAEAVVSAGAEAIEAVANDPEMQKVHHEFIERLWMIAVAAVGLIAAFAWDRFLREVIDLIFSKGNSLAVLFGYALLMTLLAAAVATQIPRIEAWYMRKVSKGHKPHKNPRKTAPHIPVGKNLD